MTMEEALEKSAASFDARTAQNRLEWAAFLRGMGATDEELAEHLKRHDRAMASDRANMLTQLERFLWSFDDPQTAPTSFELQ